MGSESKTGTRRTCASVSNRRDARIQIEAREADGAERARARHKSRSGDADADADTCRKAHPDNPVSATVARLMD